MLQEEK